MRRGLWPLAVVLWIAGMILLVLPGNASTAVAVGDLRFDFGQVFILLSIAAAWGDQRARQTANIEETRRRFSEADERFERIEKHIFKV